MSIIEVDLHQMPYYMLFVKPPSQNSHNSEEGKLSTYLHALGGTLLLHVSVNTTSKGHR